MNAVLESINTDPTYREPPANMEAEQSLLGAVLVNNDAINLVAGWLRAEHFSQPAHQRIYSAILMLTNRGETATPVTLSGFFSNDDGLSEVGGDSYLARLVGAAVTVKNAPSYAKAIVDAATLRGIIEACEIARTDAHDPDVEDPPSAIMDRLEGRIYELHETTRRGGFKPIGEIADQVLDSAEEAMKNPGALLGPTTGIPALDQALGGLQPGNVVVIGGRPSMGKSALGLSIALRAGEAGAGVGFISLEMTKAQLTSRALSEASWRPQGGIPYQHIDRGNLGNELYDNPFGRLMEAKTRLADLPIYIDDEAGLSLAGIRASSRTLARKFRKQGKKLAVLIVDHLTMVGEKSGRNENETVRVGRISNGLRQIAKDLDCCVLALCQLNRGVEGREDKRPGLSDLRHSGDIEQDADAIAFIYREEYYLGRSPKPNDPDWQASMHAAKDKAEILLQKNRQGPAPEVIRVFCDIKCSVFRDLE